MNFEDRTCALLSPTGSDHGNVCYFGFPLYYLQMPQVKTVFDKLLPLFGEERLQGHPVLAREVEFHEGASLIGSAVVIPPPAKQRLPQSRIH